MRSIRQVYKAEDLKLGRHVALKFLAAHLVSDPEIRKRFERKAGAGGGTPPVPALPHRRAHGRKGAPSRKAAGRRCELAAPSPQAGSPVA